MNKYDVRYSQGYDRSHSWRYQIRIEAKNEEEAKQMIISKCEQDRPDEKVMNIRIKKAKDYICWTYKSQKEKNGNTSFYKSYYGGYLDLNIFGYGERCEKEKSKAKRFETQEDLKSELKKIGRKISDYKIERIEV